MAPHPKVGDYIHLSLLPGGFESQERPLSGKVRTITNTHTPAGHLEVTLWGYESTYSFGYGENDHVLTDAEKMALRLTGELR